MPIGKNAIKRVSNNGYSNVKTTAPDMENSVVSEDAEQKALPKKKPAQKKKETVAPAKAKKAAPKKDAAKKSDEKTLPKKSMESEPELRPVRTLEKVTESVPSEKEGYTNLGKDMPYYLL